METAMPRFTLTRQYLLPVYQHFVIEAQTLEQACEKAIEESDWGCSQEDYDNARETTIECAAVGEWESPHDASVQLEVPKRFTDEGDLNADRANE
jgi:hypothetical protein